jgi:chromosome segregation ATPase
MSNLREAELTLTIKALRSALEAKDKEIERLKGIYKSAVNGRQEMREAVRIERKLNIWLKQLLAEAKERIPDWETGVNKELLKQIEAIYDEGTIARSALEAKDKEIARLRPVVMSGLLIGFVAGIAFCGWVWVMRQL